MQGWTDGGGSSSTLLQKECCEGEAVILENLDCGPLGRVCEIVTNERLKHIVNGGETGERVSKSASIVVPSLFCTRSHNNNA